MYRRGETIRYEDRNERLLVVKNNTKTKTVKCINEEGKELDVPLEDVDYIIGCDLKNDFYSQLSIDQFNELRKSGLLRPDMSLELCTTERMKLQRLEELAVEFVDHVRSSNDQLTYLIDFKEVNMSIYSDQDLYEHFWKQVGKLSDGFYESAIDARNTYLHRYAFIKINDVIYVTEGYVPTFMSKVVFNKSFLEVIRNIGTN